jgi:hypothetical protein
MEITGTLKNAERLTQDVNGKLVTTNIRGQLFNDTKGRGLKDGEWVITSRVQEELPGNIFKTLNSYYLVEFSAAKEAA